MKTISYLIISLPLFLFVFTSKSHTVEFDKKRIIPGEISGFYTDYNFICSFSTSSEREVLAKHFNLDKPPVELQSERLQKIFKLMKKVYSQIKKADPQMFIRPGRIPINQYVFQSQLMEIKNISQFGTKATVEVTVYALGPNLIFIEQYEKSSRDEKKILSEEKRIELIKSEIQPRKEYHQWIYVCGKWMKLDVNCILLKNR